MKLSDGLFLQCFYDVAKEFPDILAADKIFENRYTQAVMKQQQFDVMVMDTL